jgi:hypothetical protein
MFGDQPSVSGHPDQSQSLQAIDDLIGTEQRMKIFDLGLRAPGEIADFARLEEEQAVAPELTQTEAEADVDDDESEATAAPFADETAEVLDHGRPAEPDGPHVDLPNPPGFLKRASPSTIRTRSARRRSKFPAALSSQFRRFSHILRGHLAEGSSTIKTHGRPAGISGALLAVLSLVVILIGAGLFIGVNQIKTLKSEITALERQLVPLKKQAANVDQQQKRSGAEQLHKQPLSPGATETGKSPVENRAAATALVLSPDDVRLIREYIKPAPFAGAAAPPINVGDPVTIATIPLPSPLTDKVPKLLGSRFTIRNGAIIILKRDSHQADAVLAPN